MKDISNPDRPWLKGATNLFDIPGKPFGWASHEERQRIAKQLIERRKSFLERLFE